MAERNAARLASHFTLAVWVAAAIVVGACAPGADPSASTRASIAAVSGSMVVFSVASNDGVQINTVDAATGQTIASRDAPNGAVVAWSERGLMLVAANDGDVGHAALFRGAAESPAWTVQTGRIPLYQTVLRRKPIAFSRDGSGWVVQYYVGDEFQASSYGFEVHRTSDGQLIASLEREQCGGAHLVPGSDARTVIVTCLGSGEVLWIDTSNAEVVASSTLPGEVIGHHRAKEDEIFGPAIVGSSVAFIQADGSLRVLDASSGDELASSELQLRPDRIVRGMVATDEGNVVVAVGDRGLGSLDSAFDELILVQPTFGKILDTFVLDEPGAFLGAANGSPIVLGFPEGSIRVFVAGTELAQAGRTNLGYDIQSLPLPPD
jgi:hypothetical protein